MLIPFSEALAEAERRQVAVGAFTAYNLEIAYAVLSAAHEQDVPVILLMSEQTFRSSFGPYLLRALEAVGESAVARCCIQLDHATDLDIMRSAIDAGIGAVMADGSKLTYDCNSALVRAAAHAARHRTTGVEAELGRVSGEEDVVSAAEPGALSDPEQAADFIARTDADCLAIAIGNVHGRYRKPPHLDWARLESIRERVDVPLSLHGASGLSERDVVRAVSLGIRKVNVNTELRDCWFDVLATRGSELRNGSNLLALGETLIGAIRDVVTAKLDLLSGH
jgi:tagatose 1,6-diphosphate aldolase GatY/KbaY